MLALPVGKFPLALCRHRVEQALYLPHPLDHSDEIQFLRQHRLRSFVRSLVQGASSLVQAATIDRQSSFADQPLEVASCLSESLSLPHVILSYNDHLMDAVTHDVPLWHQVASLLDDACVFYESVEKEGLRRHKQLENEVQYDCYYDPISNQICYLVEHQEVSGRHWVN